MKSQSSQRYTSVPTSEPTPSSPTDNDDNNDNPNSNERNLQYKELPQPPRFEIESSHCHHCHDHLPRPGSPYTKPILALLTLLIILILANTYLLLRLLSPAQLQHSTTNNTSTTSPPSYIDSKGAGTGIGTGPAAGAAPPLPSTFSETPYRLFNNDSDKLWRDLDTPNGGFYVNTSPIDGARHVFGISMFHQLHCLMHLRGVLWTVAGVLNGNDTDGSTAATGEKVQVGEEADKGRVRVDLVHAGHCLDYIRQGIMCAADDTIEPPHIRPQALDFITGLNVTHQCRDAQAVRQMSIDSGQVSDGDDDDD